MALVNSHGGAGCELPERTHAADAIPGIALIRRLALAFVAFEESGNKSFAGESRQPYASGFAVADYSIDIVERHDLDHGARLRGVVGDFVVLRGRRRLRACEPHERVA